MIKVCSSLQSICPLCRELVESLRNDLWQAAYERKLYELNGDDTMATHRFGRLQLAKDYLLWFVPREEVQMIIRDAEKEAEESFKGAEEEEGT